MNLKPGTVKGILNVAAVAALLLCAGGASAGVIYDNGAGTLNNAWFSDLTRPQFMADDFVLQSGANTITDIHWTGIYFNDATVPDNFTIQFFADSSGVPTVSPFATFSVGGVSRADTGNALPFSGPEIFSYSAVVSPLTLTAGTTYWLSIFNDSLFGGWAWGSQDGTGQNAVIRFDETSAWSLATLGGTSSTELDFQLTNDAVSGAPEPATLALLGIGLAALGFSPRSRS